MRTCKSFNIFRCSGSWNYDRSSCKTGMFRRLPAHYRGTCYGFRIIIKGKE